MNLRHLALVTLLALVAVHPAAAQSGQGTPPGSTEPEYQHHYDPDTQTEPPMLGEILAEVVRSPNEYVLWVYDEEEGSIGIAVGATFPDLPLVATSFVESHDVVEVFLGVAELDQEVPSDLIDRLPGDFELPAFDVTNRKRLREANQVALAHLPVVTAPPNQGGGSGGGSAGGCSSSFKTWVGAAYGSSSCGQSGYPAFTWTHPTDTYCTGGGCTYELGSVDKGSCVPALLSCDRVQGMTNNRRQRLADVHANPFIHAWGRKMHYGAANCSGNGPLRFKFQRGGSVYSVNVEVNHMLHYFWGKWNLPATAEASVTWGSWGYGLPPSGAHFKDNKAWLENNAGPYDRAILCGDVLHSYTMKDLWSSNCRPGEDIRLCGGPDANLPCTSDCFNCGGGSCG